MTDRIAAKLWQTYQAQSNQTRLPDTLPEGLERYSQSPIFTPDNLPNALRRARCPAAFRSNSSNKPAKLKKSLINNR